jgi:uncharacterized protein
MIGGHTLVVGRALLIAVVALGLGACSPGGPGPSATTPPGEASDAPSNPASATPAGQDGTDPAAVGRAFIEALAAGDTATAEAMEDATMRGAAPAAALGQLWEQMVAQFGAFGGLGDVTVAEQEPYMVATVGARFAKATVPLLVTVTDEGLVAGLHLGQPGPAASGSTSSSSPASPAPSEAASPAAYVNPEAFTETGMTVGAAPWALPGTLAMPNGGGPFPAVVLVAGSGAQDRDETIGPNKPLRDLAWGLASNGIAVLRYEKRTKVYQAEMAATASEITLREETTDDAIAAVDLLRATPGIDPARVFLAGHSLGGYLAPRIAASAPGHLAGIALLEANARPLQRLIEDQLAYLASDDGGADPQAKAMLEALPAQVALVESPDLSPSTPVSDLPLGIPAAYWLDLRGYDPTTTARDLSIPIFLTQGGRDYQVPPSELATWRAALAGRDGVTVREYPALNHLLLAGSGPSKPAEYSQPGHVAPEVVKDLAAWVTSVP